MNRRISLIVVLSSSALLMAGLMFTVGGCPPEDTTGDTTSEPETFAVDSAVVTVARDAQTLLSIAEDEGYGSTTFYGTDDGTAVLTGFEVDLPDGTLSVDVDNDGRVVMATLGDWQLTVTHNADGTVDYQVYSDGELIAHAENVAPESDELSKELDTAQWIRSTGAIATCTTRILGSVAKVVAKDTILNREVLQDCLQKDAEIVAFATQMCVVRFTLLERMYSHGDYCADRVFREACERAFAQALETLKGFYTLQLVVMTNHGEEVRDYLLAHQECPPVDDDSDQNTDDGSNDDGNDDDDDGDDGDDGNDDNGDDLSTCFAAGAASYRVETVQDDQYTHIAAIYYTNNTSRYVGVLRHVIDDFPGTDQDKDAWFFTSLPPGTVDHRGIDDGFIKSALIGGGQRTRTTREMVILYNDGAEWDRCGHIAQCAYDNGELPAGAPYTDISGENPW